MKRTIKQFSKGLSKRQERELMSVIIPYNKQKDAFMARYADLKWLPRISDSSKQKALRNELVASSFASPFGLQARQWKMALSDALETILRYWEAVIAVLKSDFLYRHDNLSEEEKHYANWILHKGAFGRDYNKIIAIYQDADLTYDKIKLDEKGRKKVRSYLHRTLRKITGNRPRVHKFRSVYCDPQLYDIQTASDGTQTLAFSTTKPRKQLFIPLCGKLNKKGNARIVYDELKNRIEVHQTRDVKPKSLGNGETAADYGTTEVLTDETGNRYGEQFGVLLARYNEFLLRKGKNRNQIRAIAENVDDKFKAKRIRQNNLSSRQRDLRHRKERAALDNEINRAYRSLFKTRRPKTLGFEELSHMRGKTKFKGLSRIVSLWTRSHLKERLEFLSHVFGADVRYVNPAYTSQECNNCHYAHQENRNGDAFKCKHCGYKTHADKGAAVNIGRRMDDAEIKLYTKHTDVKNILKKRFEHWKETHQKQPVLV